MKTICMYVKYNMYVRMYECLNVCISRSMKTIYVCMCICMYEHALMARYDTVCALQ